EVGEELRGACDHRVRREVVLHRPQRIEAERFDKPTEVELFPVDLPVRHELWQPFLRWVCLHRLEPLPIHIVLREQRHSDFHTPPPLPCWASLEDSDCGVN